MSLVAHDTRPVRVVDHALAAHLLTTLRDAETPDPAFRSGVVDLGRLCGAELVDGVFETATEPVETPVGVARGTRIAGLDDVVLVSVLRAAVPFVEGLLRVFPDARQGVVSASRDDEAGRDASGRFPVAVDYVNLPRIRPTDTVVVADPMLATGSTMCAVLDAVADAGADPSSLVVLAVVAAPPGAERVAEAHPDADVVAVAVDPSLDEDGYIVPGLGDAGDRAFGTTDE